MPEQCPGTARARFRRYQLTQAPRWMKETEQKQSPPPQHGLCHAPPFKIAMLLAALVNSNLLFLQEPPLRPSPFGSSGRCP